VIFLTVGNRYPFDRLVRAVDALVADGVITTPVIAQIGEGAYEPQHCEWSRYFDGDTYDGHVRDASALIGHAGSGTIATALSLLKPLLVMPRLERYREHVNDHQVATARTFAELGSVLAAFDEAELRNQIAALEQFVPHRREPNIAGLVDRITTFLSL
jgi:UDP-N-acetylglucosamine transferase subunit ALG13